MLFNHAAGISRYCWGIAFLKFKCKGSMTHFTKSLVWYNDLIKRLGNQFRSGVGITEHIFAICTTKTEYDVKDVFVS